jgi:hypothetical protein
MFQRIGGKGEPNIAQSLPFPQLHIINLADAKVEGLEVDLGLAGHVDVLAHEAVLFAINGKQQRAFLQFDGDIMPFIEREKRRLHRERLDVLLDRERRGLLAEA